MKKLSILGSTGSIGRQCLSVVEALPDRFSVVALAAGANLEELSGQIERHHPEVVSVGDARGAEELSRSARHELDCLPRSECRSILEALTEWSVRREK